jgi:hypothetical protein
VLRRSQRFLARAGGVRIIGWPRLLKLVPACADLLQVGKDEAKSVSLGGMTGAQVEDRTGEAIYERYGIDPSTPSDGASDLIVEANGMGTSPRLEPLRRYKRSKQRKATASDVGMLALAVAFMGVVAAIAASAGSAGGIVVVAGVVGLIAMVVHWENQGQT